MALQKNFFDATKINKDRESKYTAARDFLNNPNNITIHQNLNPDQNAAVAAIEHGHGPTCGFGKSKLLFSSSPPY